MIFDPYQYLAIPYHLKLTHGWNSSKGGFASRKGWILIVSDKNGLCGYGDCAPLPVAGTETHEEADDCLDQYWGGNAALPAVDLIDEYPAVCCAMETALLDLESKQLKLPLSKLLNPNAAQTIKVNGIAHTLTANAIAEQIKQGYFVIKVKVGMEDIATEIKKLRETTPLIADISNAKLRLDANGAWDLRQAQQFLNAIQDLPVESVEEPLQHPNIGNLKLLHQTSNIPIAIDESLKALGLQSILESGAIQRIVLKPGVIGGLKKTVDIARQAATHEIETTVTTTVDSAAGVWAATQLAAAIDPVCPNMHHGLSTSSWLATDTGNPPVVEQGCIHLPQQSGLGYIPNVKI